MQVFLLGCGMVQIVFWSVNWGHLLGHLPRKPHYLGDLLQQYPS